MEIAMSAILVCTLLIIKINTLDKNVTYMNLILNRVAKQVGVPKSSLEDELRFFIALGKNTSH